jgi:hypothetical protein
MSSQLYITLTISHPDNLLATPKRRGGIGRVRVNAKAPYIALPSI